LKDRRQQTLHLVIIAEGYSVSSQIRCRIDASWGGLELVVGTRIIGSLTPSLFHAGHEPAAGTLLSAFWHSKRTWRTLAHVIGASGTATSAVGSACHLIRRFHFAPIACL